jgi:hypothetical protein
VLTLNRPNGEGAGAGDTLFTLPERKRSPVTILSNGSGQESSAMIVRLALDRDVDDAGHGGGDGFIVAIIHALNQFATT